jgi:hypothetical protein
MAIPFHMALHKKRLMFLKSQRQQFFKIENCSRLFKTHLNTKQPASMVFVWGRGWAFRFQLEWVPVPISEIQWRFCGLVPVPGKNAN